MTMQFLVTLSVVAAVAYLAIVATTAIVAALRTGGRREDTGEGHEALSVSRFTIPVSIIVPVTNGGSSISAAISSLLALNYPEFEVVIVADGASRQMMDALTREWQLEAREFFYRRTVDTAEVRRIYRSGRDSSLMVIDKAAGGYGDALNCGVNVARYRYFMSISPDVAFDDDALLRIMAAALRDPGKVIGASNHVERGVAHAAIAVNNATAPPSSQRDEAGFIARGAAIFQRLASARSLMDSRLAWRRLGAGLGPNGAVAVWRRDAVIKLNGFSSTAADADLDMMFRLQTAGAEGAVRFDRGVEVFGRVGPHSMRGAVDMAARRQRAALHILWACLQGRALDARTLAYFIESELLTPLAQAWIVVAVVVGAGLGWFTWTTVALALVTLSFGNAAVTAVALLLRGAASGAPEEPELRRLIVAAPLEFVFYRPALAVARLVATLSFVSGRNV
jgi:GT2 family glycosyltransferase